ncbi:hypothetical protein [Desulfurobacterium sp.]|nr:hypothetical protein [Desulfurobacterium sp.]
MREILEDENLTWARLTEEIEVSFKAERAHKRKGRDHTRDGFETFKML